MMKRTVVFSALWTVGVGAVLSSLSCGSGATRGDGSGSKASAPAEAPAPGTAPDAKAATTKPAETPVPSSGRVDSSPAATASGPERIVPTTKRSAAGLPDEIAGYISWFRLGPSPSPELAAGAHATARQAYVLFLKQEDHSLGGTVNPPFEKGTTILLEEKEPGKDFISRVRTMTVEDSGWKFADHARDSADKAFAPRAGSGTECAACHAKAKDDSVYSSRKLE